MSFREKHTFKWLLRRTLFNELTIFLSDSFSFLITFFYLKYFKANVVFRIKWDFLISLSNEAFEASINPLSTNPTKWSNTLKLFVGKLPTNCLSVFDHFVKLALKGLMFALRANRVIIKRSSSRNLLYLRLKATTVAVFPEIIVL